MGGSSVAMLNDDDLSNLVWDALKVAVRLHLAAEPAVFLSGGLDTGLIAAACVESGYHPLAITVVFDEESEDTENARRIARHLGLRHHEAEFDKTDMKVFQAHLRRIFGGEPWCAGLEQVGKAYEAAMTCGVRVVLGGHGGDELFGGYPWHYRLRPEVVGEKMEVLKCTNLLPLLSAENLIADYYHVELRAPFLDLPEGLVNEIPVNRLYDPGADLQHGEGGKLVLRRIAAQVLPPEVARMPKRGFCTPWYLEERLKKL